MNLHQRKTLRETYATLRNLGASLQVSFAPEIQEGMKSEDHAKHGYLMWVMGEVALANVQVGELLGKLPPEVMADVIREIEKMETPDETTH